MRKPFIAGNWKMQGDKAFVDDLLHALEEIHQLPVRTAVFPPFVYLSQAYGHLHSSPIHLGAQNMDQHESGAYTGEISAAMLMDMGCEYVLVGHSERRQYYNESDELCALKVAAAQKAGLLPILCVGETQQERQQKQTLTIIEKQLATVIKHDDVDTSKLVIAYEPIWAIGTGQTATPEIAQEVHGFIRNLLENWVGELAQEINCLYGGSVKPSNAAELLAMPDIDGALVGGASLKADAFIAICQAAVQESVQEQKEANMPLNKS